MTSSLSLSLRGLAVSAIVGASCAAPATSENPFHSACEFEKPGTPQLFGTFSLIAHRGTLGDRPENTLESLTAAMDAGAAIAELTFISAAIRTDTAPARHQGRWARGGGASGA